MSVARPLVHIGYHKTGTTWLQQTLFGDARAGFCVPWSAGRAEAVARFVVPDLPRFDPVRARSALASGLEWADARGLVPVLSHERLSGQPLRGIQDGYETAARLHAALPEARVLICVREQRSMLRSLYRQFVKRGGRESIEEFIGDGSSVPGFTPVFRLGHLDYDLMIDRYQSLFGEDRVLVLPFEELRRGAREFATRIVDFAESGGMPSEDEPPRNVGLRGTALGFYRALNRYAPPAWHRPGAVPGLWLGRLVGGFTPKVVNTRLEASLAATIARRVSGRFSASNHRTARLTGLDLGGLGYDCSGAESGDAASVPASVVLPVPGTSG